MLFRSTTMFQKGNGFSFYVTNKKAEFGVIKKVNGTSQRIFMVDVEKKEIIFFENCDADIKDAITNCKEEIILVAKIYLAGFDYGALMFC